MTTLISMPNIHPNVNTRLVGQPSGEKLIVDYLLKKGVERVAAYNQNQAAGVYCAPGAPPLADAL